MTTDPENLPSLDDESLQALITHYTGLKYKLTENLRVRERLVELQDEQLKRERKASTIEGVIRQNTDVNQWAYLPLEWLS